MNDTTFFISGAAALLAVFGIILNLSSHALLKVFSFKSLLLSWTILCIILLPKSIQHKWPLLLASIFIFFVAAWFLSKLFLEREKWFLAIGSPALFLRIPITVGEEKVMILAPLYTLIALGTFITIRKHWVRYRTDTDANQYQSRSSQLLNISLIIITALATMSLFWSERSYQSTETIALYFVPFILLYLVLRDLFTSIDSLIVPAKSLVVSGSLLAIIGLFQALTHQVWWNNKVIVANQFRPNFRTNSLLWDPNMYGRVLVISILLLISWLLAKHLLTRTALILWTLLSVFSLALWHTYSQSSFLALSFALTLLALLTMPNRIRRQFSILFLVILIIGTPFASRALSGRDETGRTKVIKTGIELFKGHPVLGSGIGTFEANAKQKTIHKHSKQLTASHTTPVTILAELGVIGFSAYLLLFTSTALTIIMFWRENHWPQVAAIWAGASAFALFIHSLLYAGFFEDPLLWSVLALLASLSFMKDKKNL